MATSHLDQLTPRRKLALGLALLWAVAFVAVVLPVAFYSGPSSWHPVYLGIVVFELTCWVAPGIARRVQGKYCLSVQVLLGVFFVFQIVAYLILLNGR
jgi:hypothetical protein